MRQQPHSRNVKSEQQERHGHNRAVGLLDQSYDGQKAEFGYSQAIFDLLKEPVSMGMQGSNSNRGRQR